MNDPDKFPVDAEEVRQWLMGLKDRKGWSWREIARLSNIPQGTISMFGPGSYTGDKEKIARLVVRWRQKLESQQELEATQERAGLSKSPGFLDMPTARRLQGLLTVAHQGKITVAAMAPGTCKTMTARHYASCTSPVYVVTVTPATSTLTAMMAEVLRAIGGKPVNNHKQLLSRQIMELLEKRGALLIFDEANHLVFEALEQLRAFNELAKIGICLFGNEELLTRIRSGNGGGRHSFARLNSRIAACWVQEMPDVGDIDIFLDGWQITDAKQRAFLMQLGRLPGTGGLRELDQIITQASLLSMDDGSGLTLDHLKEAQMMRSPRHLRVAA